MTVVETVWPFGPCYNFMAMSKADAERRFYREERIRAHPLNHPLLINQGRTLGNFIMAKENFEPFLAHLQPRTVLLAPSGLYGDMSFVRHLWPRAAVRGIDVAIEPMQQVAHADCPSAQADIRGGIPFPDAHFDLVISCLFFHHVAEDWMPHMRELARVTRRNLISMEFSWLHPLFWITRPVKRLFGNITGQVDHEHPIFISSMKRGLLAAGFGRVDTVACSYSHHRVPLPVGRAVNHMLMPFARTPLKHFAWLVGVIASKD